jgi:hypothetical protein
MNILSKQVNNSLLEKKVDVVNYLAVKQKLVNPLILQ